MTTTAILKSQIIALCHALEDSVHETVEAAIDQASDDLTHNSDQGERLWRESVLDGLRWGYRAAASVEMAGSTILRIREPGGVAITHEWGDGISAAGFARVMESIQSAMSNGETK